MKPGSIILISTFLASSFMTGSTPIPSATPYPGDRFLIITADDFGASTNINEGIAIAADKQIITTISVLTNFQESLQLLKNITKKHPSIGIGIHLNITTGKPVLLVSEIPTLVDTKGNFYAVSELLPILRKISLIDLKKELRAQIMVLLDAGIQPDCLSDQNGILSFYSPFFSIVTELASEFQLPVRTPIVAGIKYPEIYPNSRMLAAGKKVALKVSINHPLQATDLLKYARKVEPRKNVQKLDALGIPHPDLLIEYFWGNPTLSNLSYILEHLPEGTSELILHLGTGTRQENYPSGLDIDYFNNRERELETITSYNFIDYCNALNVKTIGFKSLVRATK